MSPVLANATQSSPSQRSVDPLSATAVSWSDMVGGGVDDGGGLMPEVGSGVGGGDVVGGLMGGNVGGNVVNGLVGGDVVIVGGGDGGGVSSVTTV